MNKIQKTIPILYQKQRLLFDTIKASECEVYERRVYLAASLGDGKERLND